MLNETFIREILDGELGLAHQFVNLGAIGDIALIILILIIALIGYFTRKNRNVNTVSSDPSVQQLDEHIRK